MKTISSPENFNLVENIDLDNEIDTSNDIFPLDLLSDHNLELMGRLLDALEAAYVNVEDDEFIEGLIVTLNQSLFDLQERAQWNDSSSNRELITNVLGDGSWSETRRKNDFDPLFNLLVEAYFIFCIGFNGENPKVPTIDEFNQHFISVWNNTSQLTEYHFLKNLGSSMDNLPEHLLECIDLDLFLENLLNQNQYTIIESESEDFVFLFRSIH